MNKHIKKIINTLGSSPDYDREEDAVEYLKQVVSKRRVKTQVFFHT